MEFSESALHKSKSNPVDLVMPASVGEEKQSRESEKGTTKDGSVPPWLFGKTKRCESARRVATWLASMSSLEDSMFAKDLKDILDHGDPQFFLQPDPEEFVVQPLPDPHIGKILVDGEYVGFDHPKLRNLYIPLQGVTVTNPDRWEKYFDSMHNSQGFEVTTPPDDESYGVTILPHEGKYKVKTDSELCEMAKECIEFYNRNNHGQEEYKLVGVLSVSFLVTSDSFLYYITLRASRADDSNIIESFRAQYFVQKCVPPYHDRCEIRFCERKDVVELDWKLDEPCRLSCCDNRHPRLNRKYPLPGVDKLKTSSERSNMERWPSVSSNKMPKFHAFASGGGPIGL